MPSSGEDDPREHPASPASRARPRRPTMADVAAHVGVSRQLVSLVLADKPGPNPRTRERVLRGAEDLGYRADTAAQLLRRARSRQLGVLFTMEHQLETHIVEALYPTAAEAGYELVLGALLPTRSERRAIDDLIGLRCEALILIGLAEQAPAHLAQVAEQLPVVEIAQYTGAPGTDSVRTDDAAGVRAAVDHLVGLGHSDIVHVDGGELPGAAHRREGYLEAMRAHGIGERAEVLAGDYTVESGVAAARELLERDRLPTAVVAGNDLCACGVVETLVRAGVRTPEDVSVAGYDDSRTASLPYLDLTTVHQDTGRMAEIAVRCAVERLDEGRTDDRVDVLEPELTVRSSTAPPVS
ncbi:LacI family DNA-binding transcriptional regulator [Nocardiopsis sp. HNM0947]|uniref:LacI family DNA-binding transcriptional regulator n=1 Tax=Nocardiopsis coralli TaxID=2772213 RepID=A0ABR9PCG9_9ACTN|nr:LacI family DNA-binding transcriptional regulator [Nocardiopsis coralli]MBE3001540.1 LacI family DNA-binding transcriptional regulator [Nocardiopsis coralli]